MRKGHQGPAPGPAGAPDPPTGLHGEMEFTEHKSSSERTHLFCTLGSGVNLYDTSHEGPEGCGLGMHLNLFS